MVKAKATDVEVVEVHYIGDGREYVIGVPAAGAVAVDRERADALIATGLYAEGAEPATETAGGEQ